MLSLENKAVIGQYNRHIRELFVLLETMQLEHSGNLPLRNEILEDLKEVHNKLSVSDLMGDRSLLAITGLQGSGKTTIIKRLYDIPDAVLPENSGRGEKLPVFIKEKEVNKIETYVYRLHKSEEGELRVVAEAVNPEAFKETALNPAANRDLWLECVVPERYLKDESKSIVLLPGFEKDENDLSQLLLEHILYMSNSSVMVLRKDTYARAETQKMMDRVKEIYQNVKPVIALSFGDVNPGENGTFRNQVMKDFEIPETEKNRVVLTGEKPKFNEDWELQLIEAIDFYGYSTAADDSLYNELIGSMVKKTEAVLFRITKMMEEELTIRKHFHANTDERGMVLMNFENEYTKVLKELEKQIKATLTQRTETARDTLRNYLEKNTTWPKEMKTKFFGQKPQELYLLEGKIQEIWDKPHADLVIIDADEKKKAQKYLPVNYEIMNTVAGYLETYGKEVFSELNEGRESTAFNPVKLEHGTNPGMDAASSERTSATNPNARMAGAPTNPDSSNPFLAKRPAKMMIPKNEPAQPLERIDAFFAAEDSMPLRLRRQDYKTLTVIGTMLIHETYAAESGLKRNGTKLETDLLGKATHELNFMKKIDNLSVAAPKVLKAIPIILGVDGIMDGELDLLTNASIALSTIGIKVTAAQLAGIIGIGFGAAYAARAIQESVQKANERQLRLAQAGERVFAELPALQAKAYTDSLKNIFERMGQQLLEKHLEFSGHYDSIGEVEQINYIVRKIGLLGQDIKRTQREHILLL